MSRAKHGRIWVGPPARVPERQPWSIQTNDPVDPVDPVTSVTIRSIRSVYLYWYYADIISEGCSLIVVLYWYYTARSFVYRTGAGPV